MANIDLKLCFFCIWRKLELVWNWWAEVVAAVSETLLLIMSCQLTSFLDVVLASLCRFPYIRMCFKFFRGFQW